MSEWTDFDKCRAELLKARSALAYIYGMADSAARDMHTYYDGKEVARRFFEVIAEKSAPRGERL